MRTDVLFRALAGFISLLLLSIVLVLAISNKEGGYLSLSQVESATFLSQKSSFLLSKGNNLNNTDELNGMKPSFKFAPNHFIIKFKDSLTEPADLIFSRKLSFKNYTKDKSDSLDKLNIKYKIKSIKPIFIKSELRSIDYKIGNQLLSKRKNVFFGNIESIKKKYSTRSQRVSKKLPAIPDLTSIYLIEVSPESNILEIVQDYKRDRHVMYAQPDYDINTNFIPDDPYYQSTGSWGQPYGDLWGLQPNRLNLEQAWDITQGEGKTVAVIDTGLDYNHADISDNVWINPGEIPDNNIDDDNNGFIDDVRGWNFANDNKDIMDRNLHGTHVSGTIAAVGNNGLGIIGVAPKSKVMAIKGLSDSGSGSSTNLARGVVYAAQNGAEVLNNSWGCSGSCPGNPVLEDAVRLAYGLGTVVVFAAGNSNIDVALLSPQNMNEVIKVSASTDLDTRASFSNFGSLLDVSAPGGGAVNSPPLFARYNILSLKSSVCRDVNSCQNLSVGTNYLRLAGTSMSAPHVAGLAALILAAHPTFTNEEVRNIIRSTADDIGAESFDQQTGYGRINTSRAVSVDSPCVASITSPAPGSDLIRPSIVEVKGTANCRSFNNYILEVGEGHNPTQWTALQTGTLPVLDTTLGSWDATQLGDNKFTLRLTVNNNMGNQFKAYNQVIVLRSLHEGWPKEFGYFEFPAAVGDLNGDELKDLIFSTWIPDSLVAVNHRGEFLPGWPITLQGSTLTNPAIGQLNNDEGLEVVVTTVRGYLYAFNRNGMPLPGWPKLFPESETELWHTGNNPMLMDLDNDGKDEVVVGINRLRLVEGNPPREIIESFVYALDGNGNLMPGWPQQLPIIKEGGGCMPPIHVLKANNQGDPPGIAVINSATRCEEPTPQVTAITLFNSQGQVMPGWPHELPNDWVVEGVPALGDITGDGRPELVFSSFLFTADHQYFASLRALQPDGTIPPGWPIDITSSGLSGVGFITLGDFDGDGIAEVAFPRYLSDDGIVISHVEIDIYEGNGFLRAGWPIRVENTNLNTPLIADVDGDSRPDIVSGGRGSIYAFNRDGQLLSGWPKFFSGFAGYSQTISDVDGDSKLELLVGGGIDTSLFLYDLNGLDNPNNVHWPMFLHDPKRTGHFR